MLTIKAIFKNTHFLKILQIFRGQKKCQVNYGLYFSDEYTHLVISVSCCRPGSNNHFLNLHGVADEDQTLLLTTGFPAGVTVQCLYSVLQQSPCRWFF